MVCYQVIELVDHTTGSKLVKLLLMEFPALQKPQDPEGEEVTERDISLGIKNARGSLFIMIRGRIAFDDDEDLGEDESWLMKLRRTRLKIDWVQLRARLGCTNPGRVRHVMVGPKL